MEIIKKIQSGWKLNGKIQNKFDLELEMGITH